MSAFTKLMIPLRLAVWLVNIQVASAQEDEIAALKRGINGISDSTRDVDAPKPIGARRL